MSATYTNLKSGDWGIRSTEKVKPGQPVSVTKKDGETKSETIKAVLWSKDGIWLASVEEKPSISKYCEFPEECAAALAEDASERLCYKCRTWHERQMNDEHQPPF